MSTPKPAREFILSDGPDADGSHDAPLHAQMFANDHANMDADLLAVAQAVRSGMTTQEAASLYAGREARTRLLHAGLIKA